MEHQFFINVLVGVCGTLMGWLIHSIRESVKDLQIQDKALADKVQHIEVLVAGTYVKRDDMEKLSSALFTKLDKIEAKLDSKVDK